MLARCAFADNDHCMHCVYTVHAPVLCMRLYCATVSHVASQATGTGRFPFTQAPKGARPPPPSRPATFHGSHGPCCAHGLGHDARCVGCLCCLCCVWQGAHCKGRCMRTNRHGRCDAGVSGYGWHGWGAWCRHGLCNAAGDDAAAHAWYAVSTLRTCSITTTRSTIIDS